MPFLSAVLFHSSPPSPSYLAAACNLEVPQLIEHTQCCVGTARPSLLLSALPAHAVRIN